MFNNKTILITTVAPYFFEIFLYKWLNIVVLSEPARKAYFK